MLKNKTIIYTTLAALLISLIPVTKTHAATTLSCFSTTSETNYLWADSTYGDDQFTRIDYVSSGNNTIEWYRLSGSSAALISSSSVSGTGSITPPSDAAALKLRSNGGMIYITYAESTNPNSTQIHFDCSNEGGGNSGVPGNSGDCGCIFRTPGWGEYMGKIDDIIAAIPPPPNWEEVANRFRDAIVPSLISGVDNLLGRAPSLPSAPRLPSPPDNGNLKKPTGQDSDLKGFDENDIKGGEQIDFREDESGGWDILDPIDSMPEQETFIPEEGDLEAPEVPDVEGEAPIPSEPDIITPSDPEESDNIAPSPSEPDNMTPSDPKDPDNIAPTPSEPSNPYPTPEDNGGTAPTPSEPSNPFPIPGDNGQNFPIPGADNSKAPIPKQDTTKAPTP